MNKHVRRGWTLGCLIWTVACAGHAEESRPHFINFNLGMAEVLDNPQVGGFIEFRPSWRFHGFGTWVCAGLGKDREAYTALGVLYEVLLGKRWMLTGSFGPGYYVSNGGFDLGSELEFRSVIEACYRTAKDYRFGVGFGHLSNGGISERNPGTEMIHLILGVPF